MKSFELQTFKDGKWTVDAVYDDRSLAILDAERVDQGKRYSSIRVIEENYDEASDLTTTRTIFRGGTSVKQKKADRVPAGKKTGSDGIVRNFGQQACSSKKAHNRSKKIKSSGADFNPFTSYIWRHSSDVRHPPVFPNGVISTQSRSGGKSGKAILRDDVFRSGVIIPLGGHSICDRSRGTNGREHVRL